MSCNTTLKEWLVFENIFFFKNLTCWPWMHITPDQWTHLLKCYVSSISIFPIEQMYFLIMAPVGIFGSVCSIIVTYRKAFFVKERFYVWMFLIALFDLLFSLILILEGLGFNALFPNPYRYNYLASKIILCIFTGIVFGFSISTDVMTLILTIERYFLLCHPPGLSDNKRKKLYYFSIIFIIFCFLLRFIRFGFVGEIVEIKKDENNFSVYSSAENEWSKQEWFQIWIYISEILLPVLLLLAMIYFSARIGWKIFKRHKSIAFSDALPEQQQNLQNQSKSMLRLLSILVFLFILNQGTCFLYALSIPLEKDLETVIDFNSTYEEIRYAMNLECYFIFSTCINVFAEILARSMNFYLYYAFTGSIREEFRRFFGK